MITKTRLWEVDFIRGIAFILMAFYHTIFIFWFLNIEQFYENVSWSWWIGRAAASTFLILVGVSGHLAATRLADQQQLLAHFIRRGIQILTYALVVTVATLLVVPDSAILFGVLHFIGVTQFFLALLVRFSRKSLAALALGTLILGWYFSLLSSQQTWFLMLGIAPYNFQTLDYYPLFPWLGLVIVGVLLGKTIYKDGTRQGIFKRLPTQTPGVITKSIAFLGRHALILYMIHLPIIIGSLWLLGVWKP